MNKHTQLVIFWFVLLAACIAGFASLANAWVKGEMTRSSRSGLKVWKVYKRDEDPAGFQRYFMAVAIINIFFFIAVIILGIFVFR